MTVTLWTDCLTVQGLPWQENCVASMLADQNHPKHSIIRDSCICWSWRALWQIQGAYFTLAIECAMCAFAQIFAGFVLPLWMSLRMQLRSRRQWRQGRKRQADGSPSGSAGPSPVTRNAGLDIRATWPLYLPETLAILVISFAAGRNLKLLQYMA